MDKNIKHIRGEVDLRVDYSKYQVDEVVETISDAIFFPLYIGRVLVSVILVFLVFLVFTGYFSTTNPILFFLFFILSFIISAPSIILTSCIRLINTIKSDINKVYQISIDTTKYIYNDSKLLYEQRKEGIPLSSTFNDVFKGVAMYVIRPSLKKALEKKIKFMAFPFIFIIDQIFKLVIIRKKNDFEVTENESYTSNDKVIPLDIKVKQNGSKITDITLGITTIPFYIVLVIYGLFNLFVVWLFSLIF